MGRLTKRHGKHAVQIGGETRRNDVGWLRLADYEDMEEQGKLIVLKPRIDSAKDSLISALANSTAICPEDMGFEQEDDDNCNIGCHKCWEKYLAEAKLKELEGVKK